MRRLTIGAIVLGMLTVPVYAQQRDEDPIKIDEKNKKRDAEDVDKQYKSTLEKTRQETKENRTDPWSTMRGSDDSKTKR